MDFKKEYTKMMSDKLTISVEDLTENEKTLIEFSFTIFTEKLDEIKLLNDDIKRISIELSNLKSYMEDLDDDRRKK
jgi:hypothetical protein